MRNSPVAKDLVLVGGGHSHVIVLRMLAMHPVPGLQITLVSPHLRSAYSGMLPGLIAGHYTEDDIHIELAPLCRFAGARFVVAPVTRIDPEGQWIVAEGRPPMPYDTASIDVGITPDLSGIAGAADAIAVKPINRFLAKWAAFMTRVDAGEIRHVAFVGAGAGGVELCLAASNRLKSIGANDIQCHLISDKSAILPAYPSTVQTHFMRHLARAGVRVHTDFLAEQFIDGTVIAESGKRIEADEAFFVTRARAPDWLHDTGLTLNDRGFIMVRPTLQTLHHDNIFAAGDVAHVVDFPRPKAGVYAVRQGPPLYRNLMRQLLEKPAKRFRPQQEFLSLITTGARSAVASKYGLSAEGRWVWRWKNWIDRRFMARFNRLPVMKTEKLTGLLKNFDDQMHCGGCGAKVSADILREVLEELELSKAGLDDTAVSPAPQGKLMLASVDAFRAFIDDPIAFARVAVNHALGDIYAMGGDPVSALAIITLPYATPAKSKQLLRDLLGGVVAQLGEDGVDLVGGHTGEGVELSLGFSVHGVADPDQLITKSGTRPGDMLILSKALGTGTLFAADMQARAKGAWTQNALASMLVSNRDAALVLRAHKVHALTDVTGFGLAGHLSEMLATSGCGATLNLQTLPVLPGALETMALGITSTLHEANRRSTGPVAHSDDPKSELLFDPQTAGGLLAAVAPEDAETVLAALHDAGYRDAAIVGKTRPSGNWTIDFD